MALSKDETAERTSSFLSALLLNDVETARQYTTESVQPWIEMLHEAFPVAGRKTDRRCVAQIEKGPVEEIYYIDFDGDNVAHVYTIIELGALHEERIRAELGELSQTIANWSSGDSKPQTVIHAAEDYISAIDELRDELDWYVKWLRYNKPSDGARRGYGSYAARRTKAETRD